MALSLRLRKDTTLPSSADLRRHGIVVAIGLAVLCAVQGGLMTEGVNIGLGHPLPAAIAVAAALVATVGNSLIKGARSASRAAGREQQADD